MKVLISPSKIELGKQAAQKAAEIINKTLQKRGEASIIVATGASQFEMLEELVKKDIDWKKITAFHLDEYIGIKMDHPASFRKYLKERFVDKVPIKTFHYINGEEDAQQECDRINAIIAEHEIDLALAGIGENAHLAFNDPPADFITSNPYIVVNLDSACRKQQMNEGWFKTLDEVPQQAISMSIQQIMKSKAIICSVPDKRKAKAVKAAVEGPVTADVPSSILQKHEDCWIYLDENSADLLDKA